MTKPIKALKDLTPDEQNANKHTERGLGMLDVSLEQFGAGRSVVVDKNGKIIAGNATVERALEKGFGVKVVQTDGKELIVHQRTDLDLDSDPTARGLAIADNRVAEVSLDWDPEQIAITDKDILKPFFFDEEIADLMPDAPEVADTKPMSDAPLKTLVWLLIGIPLNEFGRVREHVAALEKNAALTVQVSRDAEGAHEAKKD